MHDARMRAVGCIMRRVVSHFYLCMRHAQPRAAFTVQQKCDQFWLKQKVINCWYVTRLKGDHRWGFQLRFIQWKHKPLWLVSRCVRCVCRLRLRPPPPTLYIAFSEWKCFAYVFVYYKNSRLTPTLRLLFIWFSVSFFRHYEPQNIFLFLELVKVNFGSHKNTELNQFY